MPFSRIFKIPDETCGSCEERESDLLALVRYHKAYVAMQDAEYEYLENESVDTKDGLVAWRVALAEAKAALSDRVKRMLSENGNGD